jgi:predicted ATPase
LSLQIALSTPLQLTYGFPAPEVEPVFDRALALGRALGNPAEFVAMLGRAAHFHTTRAEHRKARRIAEEVLALAMRNENEDLLLEAYTVMGISSFFLGDVAAAQGWLDQALALHDSDRHRNLTYVYGAEPGVHAGLYLMFTRWLLGAYEQAIAQREAMLALARQSGHPDTIAFAMAFATLFDSLRRDVQGTLRRAEETIVYCERHHSPLMRALAQALHGWALARSGMPAEGLAEWRASFDAAAAIRVQLLLPYLYGLRAEIHQECGEYDAAVAAIELAQAQAERSDERIWMPELQRIKAELGPAAGL